MFNSGFRGKRASDNQGIINPQNKFVQNKYPIPSITSWSISGTDDTALNPAGGQTVLVNGTGFVTGIAATVNGVTISPVTLVSPTQISFTSPALSGGSYSLIVYNSSGGAAILVPGLVYSSVPSYTTAAGSIGSFYESSAISTGVVATSDSAITYSLTSGSLPSGSTLSSSGTITGTAPVETGSSTYTFDITATDVELQDVTRTFTMTINTDVITWSNPSSNTSIILDGSAYSNVLSANSAAGFAVSYTANTLPTGLSLNTATISGTPTVEGTTTTLLTATAATTNRSAQRTITWTVAFGDIYFKYDTTLLSANSGIQTSSFVTDNSTNNFLLTITGDTRASNSNPYQPGYYSMYFDGSTDSISFSQNVITATGNFTLEGWFYVMSSSAMLGGYPSSNGFELYYDGTYVSINIYGGASYASTVALPKNQWVHIAVVRNSSTWYIYQNGVATLTQSWNPTFTLGTWNLGDAGAGTYLKGYVSNYRITNTVVYPSGTTFTPSTSPLTAISGTQVLTCQSNRFIDNSSNNYTITKNGDTTIAHTHPFAPNSSYATYGSAYFDGAGDYITIPNSTSFDITGDFTFEAWVYATVINANNSIISRWNFGDWSFINKIVTSGRPYFGWRQSSTSYGITGTTTAVVVNQWNHYAATRSGSTIRLFVNGVLDATTGSASGAFDASTSTTWIGQLGGGIELWTGYIADVRFINGTALYTSTFTPNTTPLTAVANTKLLTLQTNGGHNNSVFNDISGTNPIITRNGDVTNGTFSPYGNTFSVYLNGSSGLGLASSVLFEMGTGNFTIEAWVNIPSFPSSGTSGKIFSSGSSGGLSIEVSDTGQILVSRTGFSIAVTSTTTISLNTWYHVAAVRNSNTTTVYINGVASGNNTDTYNYGQSSPIIGYEAGPTRYFLGWISNVRIVKGTAVYTGAFTPSTTPLTAIANTSVLTCQSNRFIDNSTNSVVITASSTPRVQKFSPFSPSASYTSATFGGSMYFDGTGDYLSIPDSGVFNINGDFTFEAWVYPTVINSDNNIISRWITNNWSFINKIVTSGRPRFEWRKSSSSFGITGTTTAVIVNQWNHYAATRSGSTIRLFVNGVLDATTGSVSGAFDTSTSTTWIGALDGTQQYWTGYIADVRFINGTALYTATFTPNTTPLIGSTYNSVLLLTGASGGIIDASRTANFETFGDVKLVSNVSPYGSTYQSYLFDGTGDYLYSPANQTFTFGTGDYTVECWVYFTSTSNRQDIFWVSTAGAGTDRLGLIWNLSASTLTYYINPTVTSAISASWSPSATTWYHIALCRSSGTTKLFVGGTQIGSSYSDSVNFSSSYAVYVGRDSSAAQNYFNGYISDFRITKGYARYTTTFTPPTIPLKTN